MRFYFLIYLFKVIRQSYDGMKMQTQFCLPGKLNTDHNALLPCSSHSHFYNMIRNLPKYNKPRNKTLHVPAVEDFQLYYITVEKICNEISVRKNIPALQEDMSAWVYKRREKRRGKEIKVFTKNLANTLGMHFSNGPSLCPCYILSAIIIFFMIKILLCLQTWNFYYPLP